MDVLPYAAHYHHFQPSLIGLVLFTYRMTFIYYRRNLTEENVPPLSFTRPRYYYHIDIDNYLKQCITFYEETIDLENKLEQFQFQNMSHLEQKWIGLQQEHVKFEMFLESLKYKLRSLKLAKEFIVEPGNLLIKEFEYSMRKMDAEDIPFMTSWIDSYRKESLDLRNELQRPTPKDIILYDNFNSKRENILNTLFNLGTRGIYLFTDPFKLPNDPSLFDINSVQELYDLFVQMDDLLDAALRESGFFIRRPPKHGTWLTWLRPSALSLINLESVDGFEARRFKYINIPRSYNKNLRRLVQFRTWVDFHVDKIQRNVINMDQKRSQSLKFVCALYERMESNLLQVKMLYRELMI